VLLRVRLVVVGLVPTNLKCGNPAKKPSRGKSIFLGELNTDAVFVGL
jgi:hypothetical protein